MAGGSKQRGDKIQLGVERLEYPVMMDVVIQASVAGANRAPEWPVIPRRTGQGLLLSYWYL